jgi:hypothetical protein
MCRSAYNRHSFRCSARYSRAEGDDPSPVEVAQLVQLHQIAAGGNEWRCDDAAMHQIQHRQQQERLVRRLARLVASVQVAPEARLREARCLLEVVSEVMEQRSDGHRF